MHGQKRPIADSDAQYSGRLLYIVKTVMSRTDVMSCGSGAWKTQWLQLINKEIGVCRLYALVSFILTAVTAPDIRVSPATSQTAADKPNRSAVIPANRAPMA